MLKKFRIGSTQKIMLKCPPISLFRLIGGHFFAFFCKNCQNCSNLVIMAVSFIGEILHAVLPLPIPASIYGLVLMLALLMTGALKLDAVEDAGKFMIEIMPVMFIPAGVGLMESWGELKAVLVPVLVITLVSTIVVMVVSGRVTQAVIRLEKKHKGGDAK